MTQPTASSPPKESAAIAAVEDFERERRVGNGVPDLPSEDDFRTEPEASEEVEDVVDILVPKAKSVEWTFGPGEQYTYVQRPLSFIGKMQWFSLVGDVLDRALSGERAMSVNSLLTAPGGGDLSMDNFRNADTFIQAVAKLLAVAPDFLTRSYCIWLGVPDWQRDQVGTALARTPDQGGLTDEQGIEIIEVFIDQNYEALDGFFRDSLGGLAKRIQQRAADAAQSRQSTP